MVSRKKALLAYSMGTGKTPITISVIEHLIDTRVITQPGIVVCLSVLKYQWADAIEKFTGGTSKSLVIDGSPKQKVLQYEQARDWRNTDIDYVIMNYEQVVGDWKTVRTLPRGFVVIDEASALRSFRAQRSRRIKQLTSRIVYALTGTPIENGRPEEIFSLMEAVDPAVLGRFDLFDRTFIVRNDFGGVQRYRNLPLLHKTLAPVMARKRQTDPDVAPYLPRVLPADPEDRKILVDLDPAGLALYKLIAAELLADLKDARDLFGGSFSLESHYGIQAATSGPGDEIRGRLMSKVGALRMLCDSPELLRISAAKLAAYTGGSQYAWGLSERGLLDKVKKAPKLDALVSYVTAQIETDPAAKLVVFTQYREMVQIIRDALKRFGSMPYSGAMNTRQKETAKQEFQTSPDVRLLVSTDAGGYGVDLPQAQILLNFDLPWASGTAVQRDSRIIRASSVHESVYLRDLIIRHSVEERQWSALQAKSALAAAVVDGKGANARGGIDLTIETLTGFLTRTD